MTEHTPPGAAACAAEAAAGNQPPPPAADAPPLSAGGAVAGDAPPSAGVAAVSAELEAAGSVNEFLGTGLREFGAGVPGLELPKQLGRIFEFAQARPDLRGGGASGSPAAAGRRRPDGAGCAEEVEEALGAGGEFVRVTVCSLNGSAVLEAERVALDCRVAELKALIGAHGGPPAMSQRLVFGNAVLLDGATLREAGVGDGAVLQLACVPGEEQEPIRVFVRCRGSEVSEEKSVVHVSSRRNEVTLVRPDPEADQRNFKLGCDGAMDEDVTQSRVYDVVARDIVDSVLDGCNGAIFCFGQSRAGKSYTMLGQRGLSGSFAGEPESEGILPRALEQLFAGIHRAPPTTRWLVHCSCLLCYRGGGGNRPRDLLSQNGEPRRMLNDRDLGPYIDGGVSVAVASAEEARRVFEAALRMKPGARTAGLPFHCSIIFRCTVESVDAAGRLRAASLQLVDLRGSQRDGTTGDTSLDALLQVIGQAARPGAKFVPYRESVLTWLLRDALGGNARAAFVMHLRANEEHFDETLSTMRFARRVREVLNKPQVNWDPPLSALRALLEAESGTAGSGGRRTTTDPGRDSPLAALRAELEAEREAEAVAGSG